MKGLLALNFQQCPSVEVVKKHALELQRRLFVFVKISAELLAEEDSCCFNCLTYCPPEGDGEASLCLGTCARGSKSASIRPW